MYDRCSLRQLLLIPIILFPLLTKNGQGLYIIAEKKETYDGEFVDGVKSGQGIYVFSNGDRYRG